MISNTFQTVTLAGVLASLVLWPASGRADYIELTSHGAKATVNSALGGAFQVHEIDNQPTGTGVINSFVRIQRTGYERGYNTSLRPVQFQEKTDPNFTRALSLGDIPTITLDGLLYRQFMLDVNETLGGVKELLSLNQIQIFQSDRDRTDGSIVGESATTPGVIQFGAGSTEVFRMNHSVTGFHEIVLDASLNSGSGSGDMYLYILDSIFNASLGNYIILYSQFGKPPGRNGSDSGFEEWAVVRQDHGIQTVPAPAGVVLMGVGAAGLILARRRRQAVAL